MRLIELIPFLKNKKTLLKLNEVQKLNQNSECVQAYMKDVIDINSEIIFLDIESTEDDLKIELNGNKYIQLFSLNYGVEIYSYFDKEFQEKGYTSEQKAKRLIKYRLTDA
jgi:hypothetical protein